MRSLAALSLLTLGACGSGSTTDAAGAPESVPFASTSTSAAPVTTPSTTAAPAVPVPAGDPTAAGDPTTSGDPTAAGDPTTSGDEMNAALITSLLSTEDGRTMVAQMMAQETGITEEQALCFLENVDADTMLALSELGTSGAAPDPSTLPPGALDDLMGAVSTCGIAPDSLLG